RLDETLQNDSRVIEARAKIGAERRRAEREQAYRHSLEEAERLRAAGKYAQAEQVLEGAVQENLEARAPGLRKTILLERTQLAHQQGVEKTGKQMRGLVEKGDFARAEALWNEATAEVRADAEISRLHAEAELQQATAAALRRVEDLEKRKKFG